MKTKKSNHDTAIILFSLTPQAQVKEKTYATCSLHGNLLIAEALEEKTVQEAKKSEIPVFRFSEHNQVGCSFGEKLSNAIESVYQKEFKNVIIIGNDCPHLTAQTLKRTYARLNHSPLILGDTGKDGVYIIGLNVDAFSKDEFASLPWKKTGLINALKNYAENQGEEIHWKEKLNDINTATDTFKFVFKHKFTALGQLFLLVISELIPNRQTPRINLYTSARRQAKSLRAPPLAA